MPKVKGLMNESLNGELPKELPKEITISSAENGWIAKKLGGGKGYSDPPIIAENLDKLLSECKKWLEKGK